MFATDMDKRTETLSLRTTLERAIAAKAIADADGLSLSDLLDQLLAEHIRAKRSAYLKLRAAFETPTDLPSRGA